jgi:hypothetical protein
MTSLFMISIRIAKSNVPVRLLERLRLTGKLIEKVHNYLTTHSRSAQENDESIALPK